MPFTPFHFGVGFVVKGVWPARTSLSAFVASQVFIDCETAYYLLQRDWPVHRWCHTFVVGIPVGLLAGVAVWTAAHLLSTRWRGLHVRPARPEVALVPALLGGALGGATHAVLDGIMHWDIRPFRPFLEANPLVRTIGLVELHLLCVGLGVLGVALLFLRDEAASLYVKGGRDESP
jgi:hypothetical protein